MKKNQINVASSCISLIFVSILLALSIVLLIINSKAWFAKNDTTSANGMTITVSDEDNITLADIKVYKYNETSKAVVGTPYGSATPDLWTLNTYDMFLEGNRANTPIFIRLIINNIAPGKSIILAISCNNSLYKSGYESGKNRRIDSNISNVIEFKSKFGEINGATTDTEIFEGAKKAFENLEATSFVTLISEESEEKENSRSVEIENTSANNSMEVYIMLNYSDLLMERYKVLSYGENFSTDDLLNNITFSQDLNSITFSIKE